MGNDHNNSYDDKERANYDFLEQVKTKKNLFGDKIHYEHQLTEKILDGEYNKLQKDLFNQSNEPVITPSNLLETIDVNNENSKNKNIALINKLIPKILSKCNLIKSNVTIGKLILQETIIHNLNSAQIDRFLEKVSNVESRLENKIKDEEENHDYKSHEKVDTTGSNIDKSIDNGKKKYSLYMKEIKQIGESYKYNNNEKLKGLDINKRSNLNLHSHKYLSNDNSIIKSNKQSRCFTPLGISKINTKNNSKIFDYSPNHKKSYNNMNLSGFSNHNQSKSISKEGSFIKALNYSKSIYNSEVSPLKPFIKKKSDEVPTLVYIPDLNKYENLEQISKLETKQNHVVEKNEVKPSSVVLIGSKSYTQILKDKKELLLKMKQRRGELNKSKEILSTSLNKSETREKSPGSSVNKIGNTKQILKDEFIRKENPFNKKSTEEQNSFTSPEFKISNYKSIENLKNHDIIYSQKVNNDSFEFIDLEEIDEKQTTTSDENSSITKNIKIINETNPKNKNQEIFNTKSDFQESKYAERFSFNKIQ